MDEDTLADLKQFISATVYQHTSEIKDDVKGLKVDIKDLKDDVKDLKVSVARLDHKVDDLSEFVGDALINSNESTDKQLKNHDKRITKLEHKPA